MDWSRIKTIFIFSFLILDIYLMYQFFLIRDANKYELISDISIEDEITFTTELPKGKLSDQYLSAKPKEFQKDEMMFLQEQSVTLLEKTVLNSVLNRPAPLSKKFDPLEAQSFLNKSVLYGHQYEFWEYNEEFKTITFYQKYDNKVLYENINGKIILFLNDQFEIVSYLQTYLDTIENLSEKAEVLPAIKAVETLYEKGLLRSKSKITKVELGYSTLVQLAASQVLAPTWHFVVEDKEHLYVNALEGQIMQFNKEENTILE